MTELACIILGAGKGTRMKSDLPKVLHRVAGRSLLGHVMTATSQTGASRHVVVAGPDMPELETEARKFVQAAEIVIQKERLGTGHAVQMAAKTLATFSGTILIVLGDVPALSPDALGKLTGKLSDDTPLAVLGFKAADPTGYGRLLQDSNGNLIAIREELEASDTERKVDLCNSGIMAVKAEKLWSWVERIENNNSKGEYYLTDIVGLANADGSKVAIGTCPEHEVAGINDRRQLAEMERNFQTRLRREAMTNGCTMIAPETVFLAADTRIGRDVILEPNVFFGPGVTIGDNVTIHANSHLEGAEIADGAVVGPFARLRPGTQLARSSKIGNFVEVKKSQIGEGAKVNHLSYIGDTQVGPHANIGAGTITCNYDGFNKSRTQIGAGAFIGSNSSLVAPVTIGDGAFVGSSSVITRDVPGDALALTRAEQQTKDGWAKRFRDAQQRKKAKR